MGFSQERLETALESTLRLGCEQTPFTVHIFNQLVSTNQTLWELIDQGAGAGTVAIASQQTAGRGQWGRQWQSQPGGLYLSLAIEPRLPASHSAQLTLCSAWGIAAALREWGIPVSLKWPNDLILAERKLGGILTETRVHQGKIAKAVVGVGINWANEVPETGINLQSFCTEKVFPSIASLEMLAAITLRGLASGYQFLAEKGIAELVPAYCALLTSLGEPVVVEGRQGVVVGVSSQGELQVRFHADPVGSEICLQPGTIALGYKLSV
ncbi:biotin--[acetyl-CoA-carboxylase] ligase [Microcoleus sp. FACHB-672]|nr:biotin--[acetyl-CoA-carboxylase] ligase [Microcoleus sp. FACHB-672]